jgi:glutamine amidotransferase
MVYVRTARHECQCADRHLLQLYRADAAGRQDRAPQGWLGITFYEGRGFRTFKDPEPSAQSPIAKLVQALPIKSRAVVSHIRQANRGASPGKHPPLYPRTVGPLLDLCPQWPVDRLQEAAHGRHRPVGDTDSEHAFCWLLDRLEQKYPKRPANFPAMFRYLATLCDELRGLGVFNMLLSDGEFVMTYCSNNLYWLTRRAPLAKPVCWMRMWPSTFRVKPRRTMW